MRRRSKAAVSPRATSKGIAITGTGSFLGSSLLRALEQDPRFSHVLALDRIPPPFRLRKAKWHRADLTQNGVERDLTKILREARCHTLVHTALLNHPIRNLEQSHELQSVGTMHLLVAATAARVKKLILTSTTEVYGAFPSNPNFLTEQHPAAGKNLSQFLNDKVEVENQFMELALGHPEMTVTILRPATILGPTVNNFKTHFLQSPVIPTVMGFDPLVQFVHERDVLRSLIQVLAENHPGTFNIVAKGVMPLSRAIRMLGKFSVPIPSVLLYPAAEGLWLANIGAVPASHLNFLKYLCVADGTRAWKKMGFKPVYTSQETLLSFMGKDLTPQEFAERLRLGEEMRP